MRKIWGKKRKSVSLCLSAQWLKCISTLKPGISMTTIEQPRKTEVTFEIEIT
jgi:hypothetical protein